jgi:hypothetical protein
VKGKEVASGEAKIKYFGLSTEEKLELLGALETCTSSILSSEV